MRPASLRRARDFELVYKEGRRARRNGISVWARLQEVPGPAQLGLAVSRKVGGAVVRNRVRRRIRAAVSSYDPRGVDVVVKADPSAAPMSFQELEVAVTGALGAAGVERSVAGAGEAR